MTPPAVRGRCARHDAGVELAPHSHRQGQLSVVLRGTLALTGPDGDWMAPPGMALWIPPGVVHAARFGESCVLQNLFVADSLAATLSPGCAGLVVNDLLRALADEAVTLAGRATRDSVQDDAADLVGRLLAIQVRRAPTGPSFHLPCGQDRRLQRAIALLRANPGASLSLDELAGTVHTSVRTLARLFVNETGMTYTRWRDHLRITCAIDRLARRQSITQTAMELGYRSPSSFTTLFTRIAGLPPRRYMQRLREQGRQRLDD